MLLNYVKLLIRILPESHFFPAFVKPSRFFQECRPQSDVLVKFGIECSVNIRWVPVGKFDPVLLCHGHGKNRAHT